MRSHYFVNLIRAAAGRRRPSEVGEEKQRKAQDIGKDMEIHLTLKIEPYDITTELLRFTNHAQLGLAQAPRCSKEISIFKFR